MPRRLLLLANAGGKASVGVRGTPGLAVAVVGARRQCRRRRGAGTAHRGTRTERQWAVKWFRKWPLERARASLRCGQAATRGTSPHLPCPTALRLSSGSAHRVSKW